MTMTFVHRIFALTFCFGTINAYITHTSRSSNFATTSTSWNQQRALSSSSSCRSLPGSDDKYNCYHYASKTLRLNNNSLSIRASPRLRFADTTSTTSTLLLASATSSSNSRSSSPTIQKSIISASALVVLDIIFRRVLKSLAITFPSALVGCGTMFLSFLLFPGETLYNALSPGSALLAKWLPVFFVPSLVTLPLADSVGSIFELLKVATVIVGGFYFTLLSTALSVVGIRKLTSSSNADTNDNISEAPVAAASDSKSPPPAKPFSDDLNSRLRLITAASGVGAVIASSRACSTLTAPLSSLYMLSLTLSSFVFGARLPKKFIKIVHPLVTCTSITWLGASIFGKLTGNTFTAMLKSFKTGKIQPFSATPAGGDILLFLLGPAVISLACQMYERRKLMRDNIKEVGTAITVSTFGGVFGTAAAVRALGLVSPYLRLSLLSRNITSPLAMAIAGILGADASLAVSFVVVTGLIGANFGAAILDSFGIKDAVARGLGIGAAAHGLGTAAFVNEKDAFPFAAIAMALTASAATVLVSIPFFKQAILKLALGA